MLCFTKCSAGLSKPVGYNAMSKEVK
jgi:hypothetical protein